MGGGDTRTQIVSALATCSGMPGFLRILARVVTAGLCLDRFVIARAIAFCATSTAAGQGGLDVAGTLFQHADDPTAFAYNAMIRGHSAGPTPSESLRLFRRMLDRGIFPDKFSFPFLLRACARLGVRSAHGGGQQYQPLLLKHGFERDPHVQTSLLHMYTFLGCIESARRLFEEMPERGTVTWNAIISGYAKTSETQEEGVVLLGEMAESEVDMNDDTLVAALLCCAASGSLMLGKSVHGFMIRRRASPWSVQLGSSLFRMYAKCGNLRDGEKVFETLHYRDVSAWTAMIGCLAEHGRGPEALHMFDTMLAVERLKPDAVTFTSVLHACSHAGLVEEGLRVFNEMAALHGVEPRQEHYGALVDLLVRAGRVQEAWRLVKSMPFAPNQVVRSCLRRSCLGDGEVLPFGEGDLVVKEGLEGSESAVSVEVSNAYARVERWEEVGRVRRTMVERGIRKARGRSCVDVNARLHRFLAGDCGSPMAMEVCESLGGTMVLEPIVWGSPVDAVHKNPFYHN